MKIVNKKKSKQKVEFQEIAEGVYRVIRKRPRKRK